METVLEDIPMELTEAVWALPGDWQETTGKMYTLAGNGKSYGPRPQERMGFHLLDTDG